jgi:hypothetical protein
MDEVGGGRRPRAVPCGLWWRRGRQLGGADHERRKQQRGVVERAQFIREHCLECVIAHDGRRTGDCQLPDLS